MLKSVNQTGNSRLDQAIRKLFDGTTFALTVIMTLKKSDN